MMCEVDDILRNLNALFAAGDPFAAKKATETWQKYESVLRKETVQKYTWEAYLRINVLWTASCKTHEKWSTSNEFGQRYNPSCKMTSGFFLMATNILCQVTILYF